MTVSCLCEGYRSGRGGMARRARLRRQYGEGLGDYLSYRFNFNDQYNVNAKGGH